MNLTEMKTASAAVVLFAPFSYFWNRKTQKKAECCVDTAKHTTPAIPLACPFKMSFLRGAGRVVTFNFHVEIHPELLNVSLMSHRTKLLNVDPYCTLWPLEQLLPHDKAP